MFNGIAMPVARTETVFAGTWTQNATTTTQAVSAHGASYISWVIMGTTAGTTVTSTVEVSWDDGTTWQLSSTIGSLALGGEGLTALLTGGREVTLRPATAYPDCMNTPLIRLKVALGAVGNVTGGVAYCTVFYNGGMGMRAVQ